jgi:rubredoxin
MAGVPSAKPSVNEASFTGQTQEQFFGHDLRAFHAPPKHAKIRARLMQSRGREMKAYMCVICGFVYEEAKGVPDQGIAPGTQWADVPENWTCPDCGAPKSDFEMVEI